MTCPKQERNARTLGREEIATPQRLTSPELLPPQQSAMDAETSRPNGLPLPQQLATRTPQRRDKTIHKKLHPSESAAPAISNTAHTTRHREVLDQSAGPVGGRGRRTHTQYCRPGGTRPVTKRTIKCPADAWLLMQGNQSPREAVAAAARQSAAMTLATSTAPCYRNSGGPDKRRTGDCGRAMSNTDTPPTAHYSGAGT